MRPHLLVCAFGVVATLLAPPAALAQSAPVAPTISSITFSPSPIPSGGSAQLTISFGNANAAAATLTAPLTDTLPAGLTVATAGASGSCPTAAVARSGGGTVVYPDGAVIPAGGCSIAVNVTATSRSIRTAYTDTIAAGALQTNEGSNASAASATLTVQSAAAVPNLVGLSQAQAATALQTVGLVLGAIAHAPGPAGVPFNAVFAQTPVAGTSVASGGSVAITLSTGPGKASNLTAPLTSVPGFVDPSQLSIASALERVCALLQSPGEVLTTSQRNLLANCSAILGTYGGGTDAAGLKSALDAVSGKTATAQQTAGVRFANTQLTNLGTRLAHLRQGASSPSFADLDLGVPLPSGLDPLLALLKDISGYQGGGLADLAGGGGAGDSDGTSAFAGLGFFAYGGLSRGTQDTTDLETGFDFRQNGIIAGIDYRITDWWALGLSFGNSNGKTNFAGGNGRLDSHDYSGSIYSTVYSDDLHVDLIGSYGHIRYNTLRTSPFSINADSTSAPSNCDGGQCAVNITGSTPARQLTFGVSAGYDFHAGKLTFGPDLAFDYTGIRVDGFSENDPNQSGLGLAYAAESGESLLLKAGGDLTYALSTPIGVFLPQVRAHFVHEFENNQRTLMAHFTDDPSATSSGGPISTFAVFTDQPTRNYFDWAGGLSAQFGYGVSAFVEYGSVAGESEIHSSNLNFGVRVMYSN